MSGHICVVGSLNIDIAARVERMPAPGETIGGFDMKIHPGGKGGNQAVAAARMGGSVSIKIGRASCRERVYHPV